MRPVDIVNLDYAASTPLRPEAIEAMRAYDVSPLAGANPNSLHTLGRSAAAELERCRRTLSRTFGAHVRPNEIVFTGGGTESNVLALLGISEGVRDRDRHRTRVIVSAIEHDSILDNLGLLKASGFDVELIKPRRNGAVDPDDLASRMGADVALVSIMFANNETGIIQPIAELARVAHAHGARFHTDAVQGWLHAPFDVSELDVDAASVAGHKVGGPVGIGALYLKNRTPIRARSFGGGQENGLRPGTQDLRAIIGLTAAAEAIAANVERDYERLLSLSNDLYERICTHPRIHASVGSWDDASRLPGIVNVYVDGMDSEELILQLDGQGFAVSAASACSSGSLEPSHVLKAMGIPREDALGSLRISFDDRVCAGDLTDFADALLKVVDR
ncbi:MAG: cysteine desulfurase family protein [Coriobacteriaceae bacterium]|nr:cysteine desulfurase family protein [Coriobacteriaceae bacterium]